MHRHRQTYTKTQPDIYTATDRHMHRHIQTNTQTQTDIYTDTDKNVVVPATPAAYF